ncbi:MAG: hypothetical protein HYZ31_05160 [Gammaproteobacteria bacterium]|jgi:hypothetical protein|nr:hypothetical protein [Gammaproteobacteria bacterium]
MKIFLIIFALVILVVVGSATMMNYFTGKRPSAKPDKKLSDKDSPKE